MRKTLVGMVSVAMLLLPSAPALASAATRVDGDHFGASGLRLVSQGCTDPAQSPGTRPRLLVKKDAKHAPLGSRFIGWSPSESSFGIGPAAQIASPTTLSMLRIHLFWPKTQASGQAVASYSPPGDAGVWEGHSSLPIDRTYGWHTVNGDAVRYDWLHYSNGVLDQSAPSATLPDFADAHGGDADGASVGFAFGCDGNAFFIDDLVIKTADGTKAYDFEGFGTRTYVTTGGERRKTVTITYGERVGFTAHLRTKVGDDGKAGTLRIEDKPYSAKHWSLFDKRKVGDSGNEQVHLQPAHRTSYRVSYLGNTAWEASRSNVLNIRVRSKLGASIADPTVTKGHPFVTAGRFLPGRIAKVQLQHFVDKKWTTVKAIRSAKDGRFRISNTANHVGVSYWRVQVPPGRGNLGAHTPAMKLTVKEPPSSGGSTPPPSDPPPPPPDDPPPPPPPSH